MFGGARAHLRPRWPSLFLELKLQLVEQPRRALGARSVNRAPQLFDLKIEMRDQRATLRQFQRRPRRRTPFSAAASVPRRNQRRFQRVQMLSSGSEARSASTNHMEITKIDRLRRPFLRFFSRFFSYPTAVGRQVFYGIRQSMPSSR